MTNTLKTTIAADRAVFLDTDEFGESITHEPLGVVANAATITAIVELDDEALGDASGDGVDRPAATQITRLGKLEVSTAVTITVRENRENCDAFIINNERWRALRILGRDNVASGGLQTVLIERIDRISTRRGVQ